MPELSRDDLTFELARNLSENDARIVLALRRSMRNLLCDRAAAESKHRQQIDNIDREIRGIQEQCSHPHTWQDSGGQYEPQRTHCSICEKELK